MEFKEIKPELIEPSRGKLLISEPFLRDFNFRRTVVLICEHNLEGSVGFIINRMLSTTSEEAAPGLLKYDLPLFYGGPVDQNSLHFIHKAGMLIPGAQEISEGIYWGGDIEAVNELMIQKVVYPSDFRFFIGYSGWAETQLIAEIDDKAWWVANGGEEIVFDDDLENMWKNIVLSMGKDFAHMANPPEDPTWN